MSLYDPNALNIPTYSLVGGAAVIGSGDVIAIGRPSDGLGVVEMRAMTAQDAEDAVSVAHRAFKESGWSRAQPRERGKVFRRWADLVLQNADELALMEAAYSSRPIAETRARDIPVIAELIRFYGECADRIEGAVLPSSHNTLSFTQAEPYGVVAAIAPWNVPLILAMAKVSPALAAGNAVVVKPSEMTPFSLIRVAELGYEAGLPKGLLNVLVGRGSVVGTAIVRHPLVRYVSFTGSTEVGAKIMADAARHGLKPVSLELGGKNPQVVFDDVPDLEAVATRVASAVTRNSGQLCFCGSRLIVHETIADEFVAKVARKVAAFNAGVTWDVRTDLPPIISEVQTERIAALVESAVRHSGHIAVGGKRFERNGGHFYEPTVIVEAASDNVIHKEEVFGPVLSVQKFGSEDEAAALAEHPIYGLAAGVHTKDISRALSFAKCVPAGMIWVNSYGRGADILSPFGGFNQSGSGKDFGVAGFEKYLKSKSIWIEH